MVIQYNKRDLAGATSIDELQAQLNSDERQVFEAVAINGTGVLESLTAISRQVIKSLNRA
jgi:signal recognition particle receptor subunit beta